MYPKRGLAGCAACALAAAAIHAQWHGAAAFDMQPVAADADDHQRLLQTNNSKCKDNESMCIFNLFTDRYPWETSWKIFDSNGLKLAAGPPGISNYERETNYVGALCLTPGRYRLRMFDDSGDGLCCEYGQGSFKMSVNGQVALQSDDADYNRKDYFFRVAPRSAPLPPPPPPTPRPTQRTRGPTNRPTVLRTRRPTPRPSPRPTPRPSRRPSPRPTPRLISSQFGRTSCFSVSTYDAIDGDIERMANDITDIQERSHFLGGIVRLAAHDFMDFDRNNPANPQGPDGCFDPMHPANAGLPEDIWCDGCRLTVLYEDAYSFLSKADFWIAAANAVIRQTSIDNALDLRDTFLWGRRDAASCPGQGERVPPPDSCDDVEDVFLNRMGLTWKDAAALMGAHSLGRGERTFSGHHGTWARSDEESLVFDKEYYGEMFLQSWRPRGNPKGGADDFTTGRQNNRVMLATDLCLVFDIDDGACCTWGMFDGQDGCLNSDALRRCPVYSQLHSRYEAREAVIEMLGGSYPNDNNGPFYENFREAWRKATTVGQDDLSPLVESC